MFKNFRKASILLIVAALLLGGGCLAMTLLYLDETDKTKLLEQQLAELSKKEKRALIEQSINKQMEDIAYEQKRISDLRTEEAKEQAAIAEKEKQNALAAQRQANEERIEAEKQRNEAEKQRNEAENQRNQAKRQEGIAKVNEQKADTLRFIALGRSLGSQSSQIRANDEQLADLLAYASFHFTRKYMQREADLYNGAVFNALTEGSHTKQTWNKDKGAVMAISFMNSKNEDRFVTVSSYGEIKRHRFPETTKQLSTEEIYANSQYDFRDVYIDNQNTIYTVSTTGHLLVMMENWNAPKIFVLPGIQNPFAITKYDNSESTIVLVGKQSIGFFNMQELRLKGTVALDFNVVCVGLRDHLPLLFDDRGRMHMVKSLQEITAEKVPVSGQVTAYANSTKADMEAYGTKEGVIYVRNMKNGYVFPSLTGHDSRVTKLKMDNKRLYSSSLDGKLNLWLVNEGEKIEPLTLLNTHEWMMYFNFNRSKERVWTCGQNGTITKSLIKVNLMVNKMEEQILKRNFTQDEWNYYIGNVPYETFYRKEEGK